MSGNDLPSVYWDSCVFLSWIMEEDVPNRSGLNSMVDLIDRGEVELYVSTLVRVEVLTADLDAETRWKYEGFLRRPNVHSVDVNIPVADQARSLREYYRANEPELFGKLQLGTADSIHLATALLYDVQEFHTYEKRGKRRDKDSIEGSPKTIPLSRLSGEVAGYALRICPPAPQQLMIGSDRRPNEPEEPS